jgi:hypothetical protein
MQKHRNVVNARESQPERPLPGAEEFDRSAAIAAMKASRIPHETTEEERAHARRMRELDADMRRRREAGS